MDQTPAHTSKSCEFASSARPNKKPIAPTSLGRMKRANRRYLATGAMTHWVEDDMAVHMTFRVVEPKLATGFATRLECRGSEGRRAQRDG